MEPSRSINGPPRDYCKCRTVLITNSAVFSKTKITRTCHTQDLIGAFMTRADSVLLMECDNIPKLPGQRWTSIHVASSSAGVGGLDRASECAKGKGIARCSAGRLILTEREGGLRVTELSQHATLRLAIPSPQGLDTNVAWCA